MSEFARQQSKRLLEFAKKNSGALIIGASLIIGLNFSQLTGYVADIRDEIHLAYYHLSGQADADLKAHQHFLAEQEAEQQRKNFEYQQELARRKKEQDRIVQELAQQTRERAAQQAK